MFVYDFRLETMGISLLKVLLVQSALSILIAGCSYSFSEELLVDSLPDPFVLFHFQFKSDLEKNRSESG